LWASAKCDHKQFPLLLCLFPQLIISCPELYRLLFIRRSFIYFPAGTRWAARRCAPLRSNGPSNGPCITLAASCEPSGKAGPTSEGPLVVTGGEERGNVAWSEGETFCFGWLICGSPRVCPKSRGGRVARASWRRVAPTRRRQIRRKQSAPAGECDPRPRVCASAPRCNGRPTVCGARQAERSELHGPMVANLRAGKDGKHGLGQAELSTGGPAN